MAIGVLAASAAQAQGVPQPEGSEQSSPSANAAPDSMEISRLVWTTMIALDQANRTGNYTVLRDLGAPSFYRANDPARLSQIFQGLRRADLGLGRTVQFAPFYDTNPVIDENGFLRIRGRFATRPLEIRFDLVFELLSGDWALRDIGVSSYQPDDAQFDRFKGNNGN